MKNLIAAVSANKFVAGVRQVNRHLMEGEIKLIFLAADCEDDFAKKVLAYAKVCGVRTEVCGTRAEFAEVCGIEVPCAVVGILK